MMEKVRYPSPHLKLACCNSYQPIEINQQVSNLRPLQCEDAFRPLLCSMKALS